MEYWKLRLICLQVYKYIMSLFIDPNVMKRYIFVISESLSCEFFNEKYILQCIFSNSVVLIVKDSSSEQGTIAIGKYRLFYHTVLVNYYTEPKY